MAAKRRVGSTTSETRAQILDAAEQLMADEGYAAVTSRSVAAGVGINAGLVHYYFPTLDDLFIAIVRRGAELNLAMTVAAAASPDPLRQLWQVCSDPRRVAILAEITAAANHRKRLHEEVAQLARQTQQTQTEVLRALLPQYHLDDEAFPPALIALAIQGVALMVGGAALGASSERNHVVASIEALIDDLEARRTLGRPDNGQVGRLG